MNTLDGTSAPERGHEVAADEDAVLVQLRQAEAHFEEIRAFRREQTKRLEETERELTNAQQAKEQLEHKVRGNEEQLQREREKAEQQRKRADQLQTILKDIHRSLFTNNIYDLILEACLKITGATRGLYMTKQGDGDQVRVRAAIDVDDYPKKESSEFIKAICSKVLDNNDSEVFHNPADFADYPEPSDAGEKFRNAIAAPVVLMHDLSGVIITADKTHGDFDEHDAESLLNVGDQAAVAIENSRLRRELQRAYVLTVGTLADAMEAKDPYTHGHCELVSQYTRLIAERLHLPHYESSTVCYAALLHDIGKIGVSDGVLNKPGPLLPEERELVRSHVRVGADLLKHVPALHKVAEAILHHHEWFDGTGYPNGLRGLDIPISSRILCVVDAYCAMTTDRAYKQAFSAERAREELRRCAGTQFDPGIVEVFLAVLDSPELKQMDPDEGAECGVLPVWGRMQEFEQAMK